MWWHTVTHVRGSEGRNWRMQWVASALHTTSEHGVSSITTADGAHFGCQQSTELTPPHRANLNGLVRFARNTKSGFCARAITFRTQSTFPRTFSGHTRTDFPFHVRLHNIKAAHSYVTFFFKCNLTSLVYVISWRMASRSEVLFTRQALYV